jgi:hypothetical protein
MQPNALASQSYDIGKAVIFHAPHWDGVTPLFAAGGPLVHLGTTEGELRIEPNAEYSELTLPESLGPSALKRYLTGTRPTFQVGLFPDMDQMKAASPTGIASLGQESQYLITGRTLWVVPNELFYKEGPNGFRQPVTVVLDGGNWLKDGEPLTAEETRLLNISAVIWKADFAPLTPVYNHADGGKALVQLDVTVQHDLDRPEGCQQVLVMGEAFGDYKVFDLFD